MKSLFAKSIACEEKFGNQDAVKSIKKEAERYVSNYAKVLDKWSTSSVYIEQRRESSRGLLIPVGHKYQKFVPGRLKSWTIILCTLSNGVALNVDEYEFQIIIFEFDLAFWNNDFIFEVSTVFS